VAVVPRVQAIATVMGDLLGDEGRRRALGASARRYVETEHDPAAVARRYEAVYDDVLDDEMA